MVRGYLPVPRPVDMIYAPIDLAQAIAVILSNQGHDIDFYAPMGSHIKGAKVVSLNLRPLAHNQAEFNELLASSEMNSHYFTALWEQKFAKEMFEKARRGEYDVLHFHHPEVAMPFAKKYPKVPVLYTVHDPVYEWFYEAFRLHASSNQNFVSISNNQREGGPDLPYIATIHNGINLQEFPFSNSSEDYLLYAGRIVPEKGVREALQVALETKRRLLIIGPIYPSSQGYFDQYIKPYLNDKILYLGYVERSLLPKYYQQAAAVLTPIQWEEPFGLTTIEAMASGTPVISFNRGAAPEIISDGKTGYLVNNTGEMIEAVKKINKIKRIDCRNHISRRYSEKRMANEYLEVYKLIARQRSLSKRLMHRRLKPIRSSSLLGTMRKRTNKA